MSVTTVRPLLVRTREGDWGPLRTGRVFREDSEAPEYRIRGF